MGYNARKDAVLQTLAALEVVLGRFGAAVPAAGGVEAATDVYAGTADG
jgi:(S)-ureidoglycine-glyoxylate aminotransferase